MRVSSRSRSELREEGGPDTDTQEGRHHGDGFAKKKSFQREARKFRLESGGALNEA